MHMSNGEQIPEVHAILEQFGEVSGLRVNASKSTVIPLGPAARASISNFCPYAVLGHSETCRYLDIQVREVDATDAAWTAAIRSFNSTLALARTKTHTPIQRALIARTVILPQITYKAPFAWALVSDFVWGKRPGKRRHSWMSPAQAGLPVKQGGIGLPNVEAELIALSGATVAAWAIKSTKFERLLEDILLGGQATAYAMPTQGSTATMKMVATFWSIGMNAFRAGIAIAPV